MKHGHATKRSTDMRFVIHCALLLLAFVGLATILDRWSTPAAQDPVNAVARQSTPMDNSLSVLGKVADFRESLPVAPLVVFGLGLVITAVGRPKVLFRRANKQNKKGSLKPVSQPAR